MLRSETSNSTYYYLDNIKIRVSDHYSEISEGHLNLIILKNKGYLIIPKIGMFKKYLYYTTIKDTINFIKQFNLSYTILNGFKPQQEIKESLISKEKNNQQVVQTKNDPIDKSEFQNYYTPKIKLFATNDKILELSKQYLNKSENLEDLNKRILFLNGNLFLNREQRVALLRNILKTQL